MNLPADEMLQKDVSMVVEYLENFVREVEITAMEEREFERKKTGQTVGALGEPKLGIIGKMRK